MSDLLSIGASGVRAYQSALTTVSENIANAGTVGYSRRTVETRDVVTLSSGFASQKAINGQGTLVAGVSRAADLFKTVAARSAGADLARTEGGSVWLDRIESSLSGNALGDRITAFFTAGTALAADPTSTAARATMLESAGTVASAFGATGAMLRAATADLDATADLAATKLEGLGQSLAKINDVLGRTPAGSVAAANLADQRDQLLDQMSALVDVSADLDSAGRATVRIGGSAGPVLVAGNDAGGVTYVRNEEGATSFAVHRAGTATAFVPQGGALAGVMDGAQRIADAQAALNKLADDFTTGVNAIQAQGRDLNGQAGAAMFTAGATPTDFTVSLTDPAGIAAAGVGGGTRDNSNLAALANFRTSSGVEQRLTQLSAGNAAALAARKTVASAQGAIRDNAVAARDAVGGVDLDSEAVDLLRFQQAYQASSRVIQVARETFQSILDIR